WDGKTSRARCVRLSTWVSWPHSKRISSPRAVGTSSHCGSPVPWTTGFASCASATCSAPFAACWATTRQLRSCSRKLRRYLTRRIRGRAWEWIFPGDLAADEGQHERAAELYRTALHHYELISFRAGVYWVTQRLGILAIRMGDHRRGVRVLATPHESGALALRGDVPELAYERRRAIEDARVMLGD